MTLGMNYWVAQFKNHVVGFNTYYDNSNQEVEVVTWRHPETSDNHIEYVIKGKSLLVSGTLGSAVYTWDQPLEVYSFKNMDLSDLQEHCRASETGSYFKTWNRDSVMRGLAAYLYENYGDEAQDKLAKLRDMGVERAATGSQFDWTFWVASNSDALEDLIEGVYLGEDIYPLGFAIHPHCIAHLIGLQMAIEQLESEEGIE